MPRTSLPGTGLACTPSRSLDNVLEAFSLIANYLTGETYGAKEASLAPTPDSSTQSFFYAMDKIYKFVNGDPFGWKQAGSSWIIVWSNGVRLMSPLLSQTMTSITNLNEDRTAMS